MKPIQVEVISPIPEGWGVCMSCEMLIARANLGDAPHERGIDEYPPEWQEEFQRLSSLILDLATKYGDRVLIRIWDPRSLQGLVKSIRHGVRRYPTFVIDHRIKVTGWDEIGLENAMLAAFSAE